MVSARAMVPVRPMVYSALGLSGWIWAYGSGLGTIDPRLTLKPE